MITHASTAPLGAATPTFDAINHRRHLSDSRRAGEDLDGIPFTAFGSGLLAYLATIDGDDPALMS